MIMNVSIGSKGKQYFIFTFLNTTFPEIRGFTLTLTEGFIIRHIYRAAVNHMALDKGLGI